MMRIVLHVLRYPCSLCPAKTMFSLMPVSAFKPSRGMEEVCGM
jgi:hypothetical protein